MPTLAYTYKAWILLLQTFGGLFLQFLKNVLSVYPNGKVAIILDNAKIRHAKLLKDLLEENSRRLELIFLPPYSPNLIVK